MSTTDHFVYRNNTLDCDHFFHAAFRSGPGPDPQTTEALLSRRDNPQARDLLIRSNLSLVYFVLRKLGYPPTMENVMTGVEGLILAVDGFDAASGTRFSTYAFQKIRYRLLEEWESEFIHISSHFQEVLRKLEAAERLLIAELGRTPSEQELAEKTGLPAEKWDEIRRLQKQCQQPVSFATPIAEDLELSDILVDEAETPAERVTREDLWRRLRQQLEALPPRERRIIQMRFGFQGSPVSYQTIANQLGISKERVRQICSRTLEKLRACPDLKP